MLKRICTIWLILFVIGGLAFVVGCESNAQTGAVIGGLAGAGIGALAGGHSESTLIGAAVGTGAGYIIGNESDKAQTRSRMYAMQEDINSQLVNVRNSNGSIVQVRLRKHGVGWVGPRGEYYPTLPSSGQLRPVYGF